ncbi:MAG: hypothetical protein OHK0021_18440 [Bryobacter sp.]
MLRRAFFPALAAAPALSGRSAFRRGVNFTAERPDVYGTVGARENLAKLLDYGVNSIAVVPYGFSPSDAPTVRLPGERSWESDSGVRDVATEARRLGLRVLMKPHIWVRGGFPGNLHYASPTDRAAWFAEYAKFLDHYARMAQEVGAEMFAVGNEFVQLSKCETEWRTLIARARAIFKGPLTYAAVQGEEFETLRFWDAVDYIGLNNYYPLPDTLDCTPVLRKVETVQKRYGKPVLFTECGYASVRTPHREPWDSSRREVYFEDQARCYEALLKTFYQQPWMAGFYWWKLGSNGRGGETDFSHSPYRKPAMDVLARYYRSKKR